MLPPYMDAAPVEATVPACRAMLPPVPELLKLLSAPVRKLMLPSVVIDTEFAGEAPVTAGATIVKLTPLVPPKLLAVPAMVPKVIAEPFTIIGTSLLKLKLLSPESVSVPLPVLEKLL